MAAESVDLDRFPRLAARERGSGELLVLLHGIGLSSACWEPVMDRLAAERHVLALDLPGFGDSPSLDAELTATNKMLARAVIAELTARGIEGPVDMAGNSLGGFSALEAAGMGAARSVVALSPGGLWDEDGAPPPTRTLLQLTSQAVERMPGAARALVGTAMGRRMALGLSASGRPEALDAAVARQLVDDFARARDFSRVLRESAGDRFHGLDVEVPLTIAFGSRDRLLGRRCRLRDELPAHTRWVTLAGCGHVPMADDPEAVARLILEGTGPEPRGPTAPVTSSA